MNAAGAIFFMFFGLAALAAMGFWIYALVDAIKVPDDSAFRAGTKVIWVVVIALTGFIGAIIYFVVGRPAKSAATT